MPPKNVGKFPKRRQKNTTFPDAFNERRKYFLFPTPFPTPCIVHRENSYFSTLISRRAINGSRIRGIPDALIYASG